MKMKNAEKPSKTKTRCSVGVKYFFHS